MGWPLMSVRLTFVAIRGADAAALFYSFIETCKLNDIEPRAYLMKLFELASAGRHQEINS